jgi:hypothetical protein
MDLAVVGFWQMEVAVIIEKKGVKPGFEFWLAFSPLCCRLII